MKLSREYLGVAVVLGIAVCFALANTLASLAYAGGSDPLSVSTARFILPAIILAAILACSGRTLLLPRRDGLIAIVLGVVTAVYTFSLLSAINIMPVSLAVLTFYLFPIFTSIILAVFGWEKLTIVTGLAALAAFSGLALALGISGEDVLLEGVIYGVVAALGLAIVSAVSSRVIDDGDPRQATLYMAVSAAAVFIVVSLIQGEYMWPQTTQGWLGFAGSNIFYAVAMIGFFLAISMIGPAKTTLFANAEPLATMATAFIFLGQTLTPQQAAGAALVVCALIGAGLFGKGRPAARNGS